MTRYLKRFFTILIDCFPRRGNPPKEIDSQETIARFITSTRWYARSKNIVKPQAFMPPPDHRLSVFRINDLSEREIWRIGSENVVGRMAQPRTMYGRADIKALTVMESSLQIDPDNKPRRHASIIGWPEPKEEQKSLAQELAADASLRLHTP